MLFRVVIDAVCVVGCVVCDVFIVFLLLMVVMGSFGVVFMLRFGFVSVLIEFYVCLWCCKVRALRDAGRVVEPLADYHKVERLVI